MKLDWSPLAERKKRRVRRLEERKRFVGRPWASPSRWWVSRT